MLAVAEGLALDPTIVGSEADILGVRKSRLERRDEMEKEIKRREMLEIVFIVIRLFGMDLPPPPLSIQSDNLLDVATL